MALNIHNTKSNTLLSGTSGNDSIYNDGGKSVLVNSGAGNDSIMSLLKDNVHPDNCTLIGGDGNDTIWNDGELEPYGGVKVLIDGGNGSDNISNDGENSTIIGGSGNDMLSNWGAKSSIDGCDGDDEIWNQNDSEEKTAYQVTINGGTGNDSIYNGDWTKGGSQVSINGGDGNDLIHNGNWYQGDSIHGGDSVTIIGGAGDDSIFSYKGVASFIDCGTGSDSVYIDNDYLTITGGNGNDTISGNCACSSVNGGSGNDKINILNWEHATVNGGTGNDTLCGNNTGSATIKGHGILYKYSNGDGNDFISGMDSNDTLRITEGSYTTTKSGSDIIVKVGSGKITISGGVGKNLKIVGSTSKTLKVTDSSNAVINLSNYKNYSHINAATRTKSVELNGNSKNNSIIGGSAADTLFGGEGNDTLTGGKGADKFLHSLGDDVITDYAANDKIYLIDTDITSSKFYVDDLIWTTDNGTLTIKNGLKKKITYYDSKNTPHIIDYQNISYSKNFTVLTANKNFAGEKIDLSAYADTVKKVNAAKVFDNIQIIGNSKNNSLRGGKGSDTISGGKGDDTLTGGNGRDIFKYSAGNDFITDYKAGEDKIKLIGTRITDADVGENDIVFTTSKGTLTLANGAGKKITIIDSDGKEITQRYSANIAEIIAEKSVGDFEFENKITTQENLITYA